MQKVFNVNIDFDSILGVSKIDSKIDFLVSLVSFLVYKEWLLLSLDNKCRNNRICFDFYVAELELRLKIYRLCTGFSEDDLEAMQSLIGYLHCGS